VYAGCSIILDAPEMRRRRRRRRRRRSLAKRKRFVKFVPWITWTNAGRMFTSNAPIVDIESSIDRVGLSLRFNAYIPGCFDRSLSHSSNRICFRVARIFGAPPWCNATKRKEGITGLFLSLSLSLFLFMELPSPFTKRRKVNSPADETAREDN